MRFLRKDRVMRLWIYFRRGHSTYLVFLLSFANFVVIQYRLLIENIPALKLIFASLSAFIATFFLFYIPLATVIGWLDMKRGAVPIEGALAAQVNPWIRDLAEALYLICDNRSEEAKKILKKWTGR